MAIDSDQLTRSLGSENTGGVLTGFLAEEDAFDRRTLWRLGSWAAASVGAVIVALLAHQSSIGWRRDQLAAADLAHQSQQIQSVAKESQTETRRLASAIETLNGDRDRLYSRVTVLEQGLESVTGALARQNPAAASAQAAAPPPPAVKMEQAPVSQNPAPVVAPVMTTAAATAPAMAAKSSSAAERPTATAAITESGPATVSAVGPGISSVPAATPATPLVASQSIMAPPDAAAGKLIEPEKPASAAPIAIAPEAVASVPSADDGEPDAAAAMPPKVAIQRTEFAVDVGGANSLGGLRALWRGLVKSNTELASLHPIVMVKEGATGLGMQLRLAAGPLSDAAAAAKICAALVESQRACETTVFDGQRLALKDDGSPAPDKPAATVTPAAHKRTAPKHAAKDEPAKKPDSPSNWSQIFGRR